MENPLISIVIPCRETDFPTITLDSLQNQTFKRFKTIVIKDEGKGAPWARNKGFKFVDTPYVLFSDNDIEWKSNALELLFNTLKSNNKASYSYGAYEMNGQIQCNVEFDEELLKQGNYISTMSLIRCADFPGFDESLKRFQDWDLWLTMLDKGKIGVYCGELIFSTKPSGITNGNPVEALKIIQKKWKLSQIQ